MASVSHRTSGLYLPPTDRVIDLIGDLDDRLTQAELDILELQARGSGGGGVSDPNVLYVESFGGVGDGVTNDTPAFQATIAAAISLGRHKIQLMAKNYRLNRQTISGILSGPSLSGVSNLTIQGAGRYATTLQMEPVFTTGCRGLLRLTNCHDIRLCDFTLDGSWNGEDGDEQIHLLELNADGGKLGILATDPDGVATTVTLATHANASQFSVGSYYDFWANNLGQPIGEPVPGGPYQCTAKNATSGVVTFATPISAAVGLSYIPCLAGRDVKRVWIDNISFRNARGDGLRFQGESTNKVRHIFVNNVDYINCKRASMTFQRNVSDIVIDGVYAESGTDAIFDMEPSASGNASALKRIKASNCYLQRVGNSTTNRMVSVAGFDVDPAQDIDFDNITVMDGTMQIFRAADFRLRGLNITSRNTTDSADLQTLEIRNSQNGYVGFSRFTRPTGAAAGNVVGILLDGTNTSNSITLDNVHIHQFVTGPAVQVHSSSGVTVRDCHVFHEASSTGSAVGINVRANGASLPVTDFAALGNVFHGTTGGGTFGACIQLQANPATIGKGIHVEGNRGTGIVIGTQYYGDTSGWTAQPRHMNNDWVCSMADYTIDLASPGLKAIVVGGGQGTRTEYQGTGTPEGNVTANVGDVFYRTDGAAGTLVYQKDTGTGNTGWVAKS